MKSVKHAVLNRMWRKSTDEISERVANKVYAAAYWNIESQIWSRVSQPVRMQIENMMEHTIHIRETDA